MDSKTFVKQWDAERAEHAAKPWYIRKPIDIKDYLWYRVIRRIPDGLIGKRKGWEAKCPLTPTVHLKTLLTGMPAEHMAQVQGGMWVTEREEWDFVSFHPDFPVGMQIYIETIKRDDSYIANMQQHVLSAVAEINCNVRDLLNKYKI